MIVVHNRDRPENFELKKPTLPSFDSYKKPSWMLPYSAIIGWGKILAKVHLKGLVGKYLANAILNKTICAYI